MLEADIELECCAAAPPRNANSNLDWLPFASLNLYRNPFGLLSREDAANAAILDTRQWIAKLASPNYALQFIGDCGHGKTTHMVALSHAFRNAGFVYIPAKQRCPVIPNGTPLFIDEAQRLPWLQRHRAFRRGVPLVLGTHSDLSKTLLRYGYNVETVEVAQTNTPGNILRMLNRRIELARLGTGTPPQLGSNDVTKLMQRFDRNVREMEHYLYEYFQTLAGGHDGKVQSLD